MMLFFAALLSFNLFAQSGVYQGERSYPWPLDLESVAHNMQSYQNYGSSPYWHDGLDIRAAKNAVIYSSTSGEIVNIENYSYGALYWEVAVRDEEGLIWKYHHVDKNSIPKHFKLGTRIKAGDVLGHIVTWPNSSYGEVFHHLHLLVVDKNGKYVNPFLLLKKLPDNKAPIIHRIGLMKNHKIIEGSQVQGEHALFVETSDLFLHEKFILPPHKISYRLNGGEEKLVWEFVHLPSLVNDRDFINDFYLSPTCGNYQCRKIFINLNFSPESPRAQMKLSPGLYKIEVTIEDQNGNKASKDFSWEVHHEDLIF